MTPGLFGRRSACGRAARLLPAFAAGEEELDPAVALHVEHCLRCQAEVARYRRMLRTLRTLRAQDAEPAPDVLGRVLGELHPPGPQRWRPLAAAAVGAGVGALAATLWWTRTVGRALS